MVLTKARKRSKPLPTVGNLISSDAAVVLASLMASILSFGCGRSDTDQPVEVSALCAAPATTRTPPFSVEFHFRASDGSPVFLHQSCIGVDFGVSSCASGFREALGPTAGCGGCDCDTGTCTSVLCGGCNPDAGIAVNAGTWLSQPWDGFSSELLLKGNGQCWRSRALTAGKYRVAIRAFASQTDAQAGTSGWTVTQDFDLPAPDDVVDVPLGSFRPDTCDPDPLAAAPTCTGVEGRATVCNLGQTIAFNWNGGLVGFADSSSVAPPAAFTSHRDFFQPQPPPMPIDCAAAIPRCSADARVVTTSDVTKALAAPSVASAFAAPMPLYGVDERPTDGAIFVVSRPDGKSIGIGGPCDASAGSLPCGRPLTDDLRALSTLFFNLKSQLTTRDCPSFALPGI
ncbi:MAG TPA: hypothetical protein VH374_06520 [Polyangia bacterium]|jgi:hypothetical protein|nr:hypothetical protein [Polyangia bacterium]